MEADVEIPDDSTFVSALTLNTRLTQLQQDMAKEIAKQMELFTNTMKTTLIDSSLQDRAPGVAPPSSQGGPENSTLVVAPAGQEDSEATGGETLPVAAS